MANVSHKKYRLQAAATARAAKARRKKASPDESKNLRVDVEIIEHSSSRAGQKTNHRSPTNGEEYATTSTVTSRSFPDSDSDLEDECGWDGTVNHILTSDSDSNFESDSDTDTEPDFEVSDLEGEELLKSLGLCLEKELQLLTMPTPYEKIRTSTVQQWEKAEKSHGLGYNGLLARTWRRQEQKARSNDAVLRKRQALQENMPKALESVRIHTIRKWEHRGWGQRILNFEFRPSARGHDTNCTGAIPETVARQLEPTLIAI